MKINKSKTFFNKFGIPLNLHYLCTNKFMAMMKRCVISISLFCFAALCLCSQNVTYSFNNQEEKIFYHTVEQGQNVYRISIMYHISEEDIYRLNPTSREYIKVGEILKIPQKETFDASTAEDMYIYHTIQPKETIYGVSKTYNITAEQLTNANPGLTIQTFAAGKTIRIPAIQIQALPVIEKRMVTKEIEYTVKRRETMFSLTRNFKITSEQLIQLNPALKNGLKAGMVIKIPVETEETVVISPDTNDFDFDKLMAFRNRTNKVDVIKIALLLPYSTARFSQSRTEFYEGFLMAVENMRNNGAKIELLNLDTGEGTQQIRQILQNEPLSDYHLIIGGETNEQIELIAGYALKNDIKYVVPFSQSCDMLTSSNASIFQVITAAQHLYSYATTWGCTLFANHQIIFVNTNDPEEDKTQFVRTFKADLSQRGIPFSDVTYNANSFAADIGRYISPTKPNLIVPSSSSLETLNKIRGPLRTLTDVPRAAPQITLFGYPEWQKYTNDCLEDFYVLNTHIYTPFFANNLASEIHSFYG